MKKRVTTLMMVTILSIAALSMTACSSEKTTENAQTTESVQTGEVLTETVQTEENSEVDARIFGDYTGAKTIEAMNCNIIVHMTLNEDGTYSYYREPMNSGMTDDESGLEDVGVYTMDGTELIFTGEVLGEFTMTLTVENEKITFTGKVPTGGPSTEMTLSQVEGEADA